MKSRIRRARAGFLLLLLLALSQAAGCGNFITGKSPEGSQAVREYRDTNGETLEIHFMDVGQGDATLIRQGNHAMLIDGGNNDKGTVLQSYLQYQGVENLDYVIGTHPDADHVGGLDVVLYKFSWDTVILPDLQKDTKTYQEVLEVIEDKGKKITYPEAGDVYTLGNAEFTVISPTGEDYGDNWNNYSVGILLQFGENRFVFTGDAEEEAEQDMIEENVDLSADVLKAAHHGSDTANTMAFLEEVGPTSVVISCGEGNSYGHPRAGAMNNFRSIGAKVYRTDEQGTIVAVSDGTEITWNCSPSESWKAGEPLGAQGAEMEKAGTDYGAGKDKGEAKNEYILNTNTKKYHHKSCGSVEQIQEENKEYSNLTPQKLEEQGYEPCKRCNP